MLKLLKEKIYKIFFSTQTRKKFSLNLSFKSALIWLFKLNSFILTIFLTRMLTSEEFGLYSFIISFASFLVIFGDLGLCGAVYFKVPKLIGANKELEAKKWIVSALSILKISSIVIACILCLCSGFLASFVFRKPIQNAIIFSAILMIVLLLNAFLENIFVAFKDVPSISKRYTARECIRFFAIIAFVLLGFGAFGAVVGYILAFAAGTILLYQLAKTKGYFAEVKSKIPIKKMLSYSIWFIFFNFMVSILSYTDILMISALLPIRFVGYYRIALSLVAAVMAVFPIAAISAPFLASSKSEEVLGKRLKTIIGYSALLTASISIILAILSPLIIGLIFPKEYQTYAAPVLSVLAFIIPGKYIFTLLSQRLIIKEQFKVYLALITIAAILNLVLNYNFIKIFGIVGAAAASVFSIFFASLLSYIVNKKSKQLSY